MNETKDWNQPYSEVKDWDKLSDKMVELGHLPPKEHSEKIEFLSRQHIDFRTTEGMKQLIQAVTWRAKIEIVDYLHMNIYVRKKRIPEVRVLAEEFGLSTINYDVKEIGWFECWFKRFQVVELEDKIQGVPLNKWTECGVDFSCPNRIVHFDLAKDRDYSAKATFEKKKDGSLELVDMELIKPVKFKRLTSTGQCNAPGQKQIYFVDIPEGELEKEMTVLLNGKRFKIQRTINKKGNPKTGISGYFF